MEQPFFFRDLTSKSKQTRFLLKVGFFQGLPIFYTKGLSSSQGVPCWKASLFDDVFVSKPWANFIAILLLLLLGCPWTELRINGEDEWLISPTYKWDALGL